jgi:hypothetical protein
MNNNQVACGFAIRNDRREYVIAVFRSKGTVQSKIPKLSARAEPFIMFSKSAKKNFKTMSNFNRPQGFYNFEPKKK